MAGLHSTRWLWYLAAVVIWIAVTALLAYAMTHGMTGDRP